MSALFANQSIIHWTIDAIFFVALVTGAYTDLRWRRLPNWLTLGGAVIGFILQSLDRGFPGTVSSAVGWVVGCALLFLPFALGGMGAGDVKMLAAVGALKGFPFVIEAALYMAFAGGIQAIVTLVMRGTMLPLLRAAGRDVVFALRTLVVYRSVPRLGALTFQATLNEAGTAGQAATARKAPALPYGVAIAAGGLIALILKG